MYVYFNDNLIFVQKFSPEKVLVIDTEKGDANWYDGKVESSDYSWRRAIEYYIPKGKTATPASQQDIIMALGQAICKLNDRMSEGL